jgi:hypothetical protein
MPLDALLVSIAVTAVYVGFAVALAWADQQTTNRDKKVQEPKRRSL